MQRKRARALSKISAMLLDPSKAATPVAAFLFLRTCKCRRRVPCTRCRKGSRTAMYMQNAVPGRRNNGAGPMCVAHDNAASTANLQMFTPALIPTPDHIRLCIVSAFLRASARHITQKRAASLTRFRDHSPMFVKGTQWTSSMSAQHQSGSLEARSRPHDLTEQKTPRETRKAMSTMRVRTRSSGSGARPKKTLPAPTSHPSTKWKAQAAHEACPGDWP
mmetsp:Transcript_68648/g.210477  ORF Transcript_68648/g.210477 Transcript_68648/m.210477 type:complete len:219 (+) Transcript_68648:885-1541(+)